MLMTTAQPLLSIDALRVTYGGVTAVDNVTFDVPRGAVFGLIGPNGAGKTSLIDALTGYTRAASGRVVFAGRDITGDAPHRRARAGLARTFQSVELFDDLTVSENLAVATSRISLVSTLHDLVRPPRDRDRRAITEALELCGLEDVADRYPTELSHGRRKLVGVARALAARPSLVLLDEPAAGLDTQESLELGLQLQKLPARGVTVLLVDHDMSLVLAVCDTLLVLDFGRAIATGTPEQVRTDAAVIEAYLGVP